MKQLRIPPAAIADEKSAEILRVWIAECGPTVSLQTGWHVQSEDTKEVAWGWLLADVVFHVAKALNQQTGYPEEFIRNQIKESLLQRLQNSPDHYGGSLV